MDQQSAGNNNLGSEREANALPEKSLITESKNSTLLHYVDSCKNTRTARDDSYWTFRENSLELIKLSSIKKVSLGFLL